MWVCRLLSTLLPLVGDWNRWVFDLSAIDLVDDTADLTIRWNLAVGFGGESYTGLDNITFSSVPEPSTGVLLGIGLAFAGGVSRRSR